MKAKTLRIIAILMLALLVLAIGTLVAGAIAKSNLAKKYPAPGQLVDVGGHNMHINCTGQGSPTVILAAGTADFSTTWAYVQPAVAKLTRVCAYDRAGMGWSEASPLPRTAGTTVTELHTLLVNAKTPGPYVLVGHSLGGMHMRLYAHNYPDEVLGLCQSDMRKGRQGEHGSGTRQGSDEIQGTLQGSGIVLKGLRDALPTSESEATQDGTAEDGHGMRGITGTQLTDHFGLGSVEPDCPG